MKIYVLMINYHDNEPSIYLFKSLKKAENWKATYLKIGKENGLHLDADVTIEERFFAD